jgi:hypothetical protein
MFNHFLRKRCLSFLLFSFLCLFFRYSFCPKANSVHVGNKRQAAGYSNNKKDDNKMDDNKRDSRSNKSIKPIKPGKPGKPGKSGGGQRGFSGGGAVAGGVVQGGVVGGAVGGAVGGVNFVAQQQMQMPMQQPQVPQVPAASIVQLLNSGTGELAMMLQNPQVVANQQIVAIINQMLLAVRQQIQAIQVNAGMLTQMQIQQLMLFLTQINGFITQIYQLNQQMQQVLVNFAGIMMQVNLQINPQPIRIVSDVAQQRIDVAKLKEQIGDKKKFIEMHQIELQKLKKMLPLEIKEAKAAARGYRKNKNTHSYKANSIKDLENIINKGNMLQFYIYINRQGKGHGNEKDANAWDRFLSSPEIIKVLDDMDKYVILFDSNNKKEDAFLSQIGYQGQEGLYKMEIVGFPFNRKNTNSAKLTPLASGPVNNYTADQIAQIMRNSMPAAAAA